jgi:hypothetical protein
MATTTWKQVVYDVADAVREVKGSEDLIPVGELAESVSSLNVVNFNTELTQEWQVQFDSTGTKNIRIDDNGYIYVSNSKIIHKLSDEGVELWSFTTSSAIQDILLDKESVYVGSSNTLYKLSTSGEEIWSVSQKCNKLQLLDNGNISTIASAVLYEVSTNGVLAKSATLDNRITTGLRDQSGNIYAVNNKIVYKFDPSGVNVLWEFDAPSEYGPYSIYMDYEGYLYAYGGCSNIFKFDSNGLIEEIRDDLGNTYNHIFVDKAGTIYAVGQMGLAKFNNQHEFLWRYVCAASNYVLASVGASRDGRVYTSDGGVLQKFRQPAIGCAYISPDTIESLNISNVYEESEVVLDDTLYFEAGTYLPNTLSIQPNKTGQYVWEQVKPTYKQSNIPQQTEYFLGAGNTLSSKTIYYSSSLPTYNIETQMWHFDSYDTLECSNSESVNTTGLVGKYMMFNAPYSTSWRLIYDIGVSPKPSYTYMFSHYISWTTYYSDTTTATHVVSDDSAAYPDCDWQDGCYYDLISNAEEVAY